MKINTQDYDKWHASYKKLKDEKKADYLIKTLNSNVPDEFFKEGDMEGIIFEEIYSLKKYKEHEQMLELYDCSEKYRHLFKNRYHLDSVCIDYYLYMGDIEKIKKHLNGFLEQIVASIDFFIPVLDKVMYYGHSDLALEASVKSFAMVKGTKGLLSGSEQEFFKIIYIEKLYSIYKDMKSGALIERNDIVEYFKNFDYEMEDWELDRMQYFWAGEKIKSYTFKEFVNNRDHFADDIFYMFLRYADSKNMPFAVAYDIWDIAFDSFNKKAKEAQKSKTFDSIFMLNKEKYDCEISGRIDEIFSNQVTVSFAVVWGMEYMYDFLKTNWFISNEVYEDSLMIINDIKDEIIYSRINSIWQYNFINKWDKSDSISDEEEKDKKDFFQDSFSSFIVMLKDE